MLLTPFVPPDFVFVLYFIFLVLPGGGGSVVVGVLLCSRELFDESRVADFEAVTMVTFFPSLVFLMTFVSRFRRLFPAFGLTSLSSSSSPSISSSSLVCETTLRPMFWAIGLVASSLMSR